MTALASIRSVVGVKTTAAPATARLAFRLEPVATEKAQVAEFLGICPRSVRNFTARGLLRVIRVGRRRLYRRDAVLAALQEMER